MEIRVNRLRILRRGDMKFYTHQVRHSTAACHQRGKRRLRGRLPWPRGGNVAVTIVTAAPSRSLPRAPHSQWRARNAPGGTEKGGRGVESNNEKAKVILRIVELLFFCLTFDTAAIHRSHERILARERHR